MQATAHQHRIVSANRELMLLSLASVACAAVLTLSLADSRAAQLAGLDVRHLLLMALGGGGVMVALGIVWHNTTTVRRVVRRAQEETFELRRSLLLAEAVIKAEPQILIYWEPVGGLKVVTHTLTGIAGVPQQQPQLIRFGTWLEPGSAAELKAGLDSLFADGRPFNLLLKTSRGGHVEADGRAAGSRAVLRMRDVAGYKRDLVKVIDQQRQLNREIRASRGLFDAFPFPVWFRGVDGKIEWVNAAYGKAVETADSSEAVARQLELLETRQRTALAKGLGGGKSFARRMPLLIDGERKPHNVVAVAIERGVAAAAIDITSLETAHGELNQHISAYDRTLDRVATAVAIFDRDHRLTFYNEAYRKLWQFDAAWLDTNPGHGEVLDRLRSLSRLPPVVDYRQWKATVAAGPLTGAAFEDWWMLPDGRMLHVIAEQRPDGGVAFFYDDATERLALESRYNALIGVQRETLDSLKEGVAVFGTDGRLKLFNSAFVAIWRLAQTMLAQSPHIDEIIAQARILYDEPVTWLRLSRAVTALSDKREPIEGQMLRPDSSTIEYAATPLPDGATLLTFADVTASKRYERALLERNEALVAGDRLKSQFISHVSYELRTPLTNIIGFSELLASPRTGPLNGKQREYLGDISGSSTTLLSIIDDILDLATIDAGALELRKSTVVVRDVINAAVTGVRERAARARIKIEISLADERLELVADEARVRQVLYNLLSNAIGFSNPGGTVRLAVRQEAGMVVFIVEDQGVGIPKDQQHRVFDRFESRAQGGKHRGTGLGLAIVKSLVDLHEGDMKLASEPGRGTRVTARFPQAGSGTRPAALGGAA